MRSTKTITKNQLRVIEHDKLKASLCAKIDRLEAGLKIKDKGRRIDFGCLANPGRTDVTCEGTDGATVVIELKCGKAGRRALGQLLSYMGALTTGKKALVRGILVAERFSPQCRAAASLVPSLRLAEHKSLSLTSGRFRGGRPAQWLRLPLNP